MPAKRPSFFPVGSIVTLCFIMAMGAFLAQQKGNEASESPRRNVTVLEVRAIEKKTAAGLDTSTHYYVYWGNRSTPRRREITKEMAEALSPGDEIEIAVLDGYPVVVGGPGYGDFSDSTRTARLWIMMIAIGVALVSIVGYLLAFKAYKDAKRKEAA
jgi:hypothetical protein